MNVTKLIAAAMMVCGLSAFAQGEAPAAGGGEAPAAAPAAPAEKAPAKSAHKGHAHHKKTGAASKDAAPADKGNM